MILCKASQTAISKAVCYKTKNEQLREKAVHFLLVAINCFYAGLPTVFCTITTIPGVPPINLAQRKIPVVLSFPYHRHKAGIANDWQMVLWTFAVSGALWRSSRSLL